MKKKIWVPLLCLVLLAALAFALWSRPKGMEQLADMGTEDIFMGILQFFDEERSCRFEESPQLMEELYAFRFFRPTPCGALIHQCRSYGLSLVTQGGNRRARFILLEDGTLWDGDWRYELAGGKSAQEALTRWLQAVADLPEQ